MASSLTPVARFVCCEAPQVTTRIDPSQPLLSMLIWGPRAVLVEGLGVDGDAHAGATVQHLWDMQKDPTKPNLRQACSLRAG